MKLLNYLKRVSFIIFRPKRYDEIMLIYINEIGNISRWIIDYCVYHDNQHIINAILNDFYISKQKILECEKEFEVDYIYCLSKYYLGVPFFYYNNLTKDVIGNLDKLEKIKEIIINNIYDLVHDKTTFENIKYIINTKIL